jgi:hypothetical protein
MPHTILLHRSDAIRFDWSRDSQRLCGKVAESLAEGYLHFLDADISMHK